MDLEIILNETLALSTFFFSAYNNYSQSRACFVQLQYIFSLNYTGEQFFNIFWPITVKMIVKGDGWVSEV